MRAGYGKYELTPPMGVELAGFGYYLERRAQTVIDPLFARAVMLETDDQKSLIISCEVLGLSREVCADVFEHAGKYGVAPENVIIVSVHTHTGPTIIYHEGTGAVDPDYVATVAGRIAKAIDQAQEDLDEVVSLSHMSAPLPGDYIYNRADPDNGPVDRTVRGFTVARQSKQPIAMVSAACHGVFRQRIPHISADFAGGINRIMEESGALPIYLNGLCGDIDPWNPTPERLEEFAALVTSIFEKDHAALPLTLESGSIPFTLRLTPVTREDILSAAETAVKNAGSPDEGPARVALIWKDEMLEKLDRLTDTEEICGKYLILGGVPVVALPFEGFTCIGQEIRELIGREDALTLGCAEELLGYLPTKDDIKRGAYAALESTFLYKRLPVVPGEAERLGEEMGKALKTILNK